MPTGVALRDPRELLFEAAERVLLRDGPAALTSRAVTTEAGVAKGVLHRHFADFDAFLAELVLDHVAQLDAEAARLQHAVGGGTVADNLTVALTSLFGPVAVAVVALVVTRHGLRVRLHQKGAARLPLIAEGTAMISAYLRAEQQRGRLNADADVSTLAVLLIGAVHLRYTESEAAMPGDTEVRAVVTTVIASLVPPG